MNRRSFLKLLGLCPVFFLQKLSSPKYREVNDNTSSQNILIIVFDTLSAENMSLYGYARNTTPKIEHFSKNATVFHCHYAGGNFTTPGTASLLTGTYPWTHRALQMRGQSANAFEDRNLFSHFQENYFTFAYTHNPLVFNLLHQYQKHIDHLKKITELCLSADTNVDDLFGHDFPAAYDAELLLLRNGYEPDASLFLSIFDQAKRFANVGKTNQLLHDLYPRGVPNLFDEEAPSFMQFTIERAIDWVIDQIENCPRPFLGYIHLLPPHGPFTTRKEFLDIFKDDWQPTPKPTHHFKNRDGNLNELRRFYDESIAYVDSEFGRLYDSLTTIGIHKNTNIILTSDHGEMFERGIFSHITQTLYEPIIHIPLIISRPNQTARQDIYQPTSAVDLLPTLAKICNQKIPNWYDGIVLPPFSKEESSRRNIFILEAKESSKHRNIEIGTLAMISDHHKLIYYWGYPDHDQIFEQYNLIDDPQELNNIYNPKHPTSIRLRTALLTKIDQFNKTKRFSGDINLGRQY